MVIFHLCVYWIILRKQEWSKDFFSKRLWSLFPWADWSLRRHHLWFVKKIPVSECYQLIIDVNLNVFQGLRKCIIDRDHFKIFGITIFNENIYYSFLIKFYDLSSIIWRFQPSLQVEILQLMIDMLSPQEINNSTPIDGI